MRAQAAAGGAVLIAWAAGGRVYMNGTMDCWECCVGSAALDTFQVTTVYAGPNMTQSGSWVNTSWLFDPAAATVTLTPTTPAAPGKPYVVVRYAASLWPQCAWYSASNDVPARAFSDLNITAAS